MRTYFSNLYGNSATKNRLGSAIDSGTMPHAFLIIGPDGSGKKTLALEIASALNCESRCDKSLPLPCHKCNSCRRIKEGNYADIMRLGRSDGKATIGVEEVRLFREDMFLSPTESSYKIYVIDESEKLTPNAQNALLTVLEEPPRNVMILLLAESGDKILATIKSRAQSIAMERFDIDNLKTYLVEKNDKAALYSRTNGDMLNGILMSADGRIGRALTLLSEKEARENSEQRQLIEEITNALRPSAPYSRLYTAITELPTSRAEFSESLESLICALRDITLVKFDKDVPLLFYSSKEKAIELARELNTKRLLALYELLKDALADVSKNVGVTAIMAELGAKIRMI